MLGDLQMVCFVIVPLLIGYCICLTIKLKTMDQDMIMLEKRLDSIYDHVYEFENSIAEEVSYHGDMLKDIHNKTVKE